MRIGLMSLLACLPSSTDRFIFAGGVLSFLLCLWSQRVQLGRYNKAITNIRTEDDTHVSSALFRGVFQIGRLALPTVHCKEFIGSTIFILLFFIKSILRVAVSSANGSVLHAMIGGVVEDRWRRFSRALLLRVGVTLASAVCGGMIEHLRPWLIGCYRERLSRHFQRRFYSRLTYYQATVLDKRLESADTVISTYCGEFAEHFAELPYYFVLPALECVTSTLALTRQVGGHAAALTCGTVAMCVALLQSVLPPFGRIHAALLAREDDYRRMLTSGLNNVECIAMHGGGRYTRQKLDCQLGKLKRMLNHFALAKGHSEVLEVSFSGLLQTISTVIVFYSSLYGGKKGLNDIYVELQYMQDLNDSVKDFVVNFREVSHLTTFTTKLAEFDTTLDSIARGTFIRSIPEVLGAEDAISSPICYTHINYLEHKPKTSLFTLFSFAHVRLATPAGQLLFTDLDFDITSEQDWVILGENGCGKTSLLRMISGLWPVTGGRYSRDKGIKLLFAPQHSYMVPQCTLLEQVLFPSVVTTSEKINKTFFKQAIELSGAKSVIDVLGGYDSPFVGLNVPCSDETYDWSSLSGGQKQRISMARVFYQVLTLDRNRETPVAILDEATSMMDETEQDVLLNLRRLGVRMLSVTHRDEVVAHHTHVLKLQPGGKWTVAPVPNRLGLDGKTIEKVQNS